MSIQVYSSPNLPCIALYEIYTHAYQKLRVRVLFSAHIYYSMSAGMLTL